MKKLLIGILAVLLLVVGAVLVIPSLIDWNTYKAEIAERIGAATGRAVTLDGNIDLALLPRPTLSVSGARLANLPGASEPDMVRLRKLDVRVAFMPLLRGRIQVQSVALIEPVIALEVLADGRRNWDFAPTANAARRRPTGWPKPFSSTSSRSRTAPSSMATRPPASGSVSSWSMPRSSPAVWSARSRSRERCWRAAFRWRSN